MSPSTVAALAELRRQRAGQFTIPLDAVTGHQPPEPYRVLLVADDMQLLDSHAAVLRAAGMTVQPLSQPLLTMETLHGFSADVVLLELCMSAASGPELAALLRMDEVKRYLPILFLAAIAEMPRQLLVLDLGGDDFLVQPTPPEQLVTAVKVWARRARQGAALRQRLEISHYEREREYLALERHAIVSVADRAITRQSSTRRCGKPSPLASSGRARSATGVRMAAFIGWSPPSSPFSMARACPTSMYRSAPTSAM